MTITSSAVKSIKKTIITASCLSLLIGGFAPLGQAHAQSAAAKTVITQATAQIGAPFRFGGESPTGFDASGYVQYIYAKVGVKLPRLVRQQATVGKKIAKSELQEGDLVFFTRPGYNNQPSLVGIYIGDDKFVASASAYGGVAIRSMNTSYYRTNYLYARRVLDTSSSGSTTPSTPQETPRTKPAPSTPSNASSKATQVINEAKKWMGYPYRFGADGPHEGAMDCSAFVRYVFNKVGVSLPRVSRSQATRGTRVNSISALQPGDLLFFHATNTGPSNRVDHVGIYIGDGKFIHTYKPGIGVTINSLSGFWKQRYLFARRVL